VGRRLLLPAAVAGLIWVLSSQPDPGPDLGGLQPAASYVAHVVVYAALWMSLAWALRWRRPGLAFVLTVAYGVVDEVHQSFVEGRDATAVDVVADALGASVAWAVTRRLRRGDSRYDEPLRATAARTRP
jgi:VanZ family protein